MTKITFNVLRKLLIDSLNDTLKNDGDILKRGSGRIERLFVGRLACNLESRLKQIVPNSKKIKVDAPYNKHGNDPKGFEIDLAIHERGNDFWNVLVMEVEINNNPKKDDTWKLQELTKSDSEYRYNVGLFLVFGVKNKAGKILCEYWYTNGIIDKEIGTPLIDSQMLCFKD